MFKQLLQVSRAATPAFRTQFSRNISTSQALFERQKGTVKWFSVEKGYGFISPADGTQELFVHYSSIRSDGFRSLADGEPVEFEEAKDESNGKVRAEDVTGPNGEPVVGSQRRPQNNDFDNTW